MLLNYLFIYLVVGLIVGIIYIAVAKNNIRFYSTMLEQSFIISGAIVLLSNLIFWPFYLFELIVHLFEK